MTLPNATVVSLVISMSVNEIDPDTLAVLEKQVAERFPYHEIVVVAETVHGLDEAKATALAATPNLRCSLIDGTVSPELKQHMLLLEAIGDYVLFFNPEEKHLLAALLDSVEKAQDGGYDAVSFRRDSDKNALEVLFEKTFEALAGYRPQTSLSESACYSRGLVNAINGNTEYSTPLKFLPMVIASRRLILDYPQIVPKGGRDAHFIAARLLWAMEALGTASPRLLRIAAALCLFTGLACLVYALYVLAICIFRVDMQPGWFSSNLVLSTMMGILFFTLGIFSVVGASLIKNARQREIPKINREISGCSVMTQFTSNVDIK